VAVGVPERDGATLVQGKGKGRGWMPPPDTAHPDDGKGKGKGEGKGKTWQVRDAKAPGGFKTVGVDGLEIGKTVGEDGVVLGVREDGQRGIDSAPRPRAARAILRLKQSALSLVGYSTTQPTI
jgi:hypothetical protein